MKVSILGGGPAGLYFSILLKKSRPDCEIALYERNRADDTFGFGVVFSDQTLDIFKRYDPVSHAAILDNFAYWDDIAVHFKNEVIRVGGNGFCGCSRQTLLRLLQERAAGLGVALHFEQEITRSRCFRRQRSDRRRGRHQQPGARALRGPFQAGGRFEAQQIRLAGFDASVRRLHLLLPGDGLWRLHRALLPV